MRNPILSSKGMDLQGILNDYRHSPLQIIVDCKCFEHNKPEFSSSMVLVPQLQLPLSERAKVGEN